MGGKTDNPEKRERQHQTSCPSGRMVHSVPGEIRGVVRLQRSTDRHLDKVHDGSAGGARKGVGRSGEDRKGGRDLRET